VAVAAMILIIGLVAVAELVPTWLNSNGANRTNSVALVIGQRILDEMLDQPISAST
jgi:Tfp pilus assembly protein PilV